MNRLVHIYVQIDGRMNIQTLYRQIDRQMTTNRQTDDYIYTCSRMNRLAHNYAH